MFGPGSTEDDRLLGAPGLPREAEEGLSGNDVLKFGGASREKPGMSVGFNGLGFMVGELPCGGGTELLDIVGPDFVTEDDLLDGAELDDTVDGTEGRLVGVADLDEGLLTTGSDGLDVGVEDLTGVDDRGGANDFDGKVVREGGVEGLVGFEAAGNVGRPVGVAGLDEL